MHASVLTWAGSVLPDLVTGRDVIEVGSYDVNGSVRPTLEPLASSYLGVDVSPGPSVDVVADVADLPTLYPDGFDVVITTEMLEHVASWKAAIKSLVKAVKRGGVLALTTRSLGFPLHNYPVDTWRYSVDEMRAILEGAGLVVDSSEPDPQQNGVFAVAHKPAKWTAPKGADWWPGFQLPIWDGSIPEAQ